MIRIKEYLPSIIISVVITVTAYFISMLIPNGILGETLIALILGMFLNPFLSQFKKFDKGIHWISKTVLRAGIIMAGITLSFTQVFAAGKYALILMVFTLATSFGVGYLCHRIFKIGWKLSSLLSVSTAICGGTAVATLGPTIRAKDRDIAYAISATFVFDIITVIAFPWIGRLLDMSNTGYGLWVGTAVNDTSSVVAAGYAFSDAAGSLATIVKLTRTLFIVPIVLVFSWVYTRIESSTHTTEKVKISSIFPWFILGFLAVVGLRSVNIIPYSIVVRMSHISKFFLSMALASIGLKTSLKEVAGVGIKPMIAGIVIDTSVVFVALFAQSIILKYL